MSATVTPILISIVGALAAIVVSILSARSSNHNNIIRQTRKLKEDHYVAFIEDLHDLAADNKGEDANRKYAFARDKILIVASEEVVRKILFYEEKTVRKSTNSETDVVVKSNDLHDMYLTEIIKSIRKDLKLKDKNFPQIGFLNAT